jgi:hypothetical protein
MPVITPSTRVKRLLVGAWTLAFCLAVVSLFLYRNVQFGGRILLVQDQVASYALSILNIFSGPILSIAFYNLDQKLTSGGAVKGEHVLLAAGSTILLAGVTILQFYIPVIFGLGNQESIGDRLNEVDAFLSIINTALVLPLNVMVFSSESYE